MDQNASISNSGAVGNDFNMSGENVAGRDINNNYFSATESEENAVICPYCNTEPSNIPEDGEITCPSCGEIYYEWKPNASTVAHYKNLPSEHSHRYGDLMFQVTANIRLEDYKRAQEKCLEAIELSSRTSIAWEYLAYCYYLGNRKEDIIKSNADKLIQYFKIAEEADPNSQSLNNIKRTIAHKLYHVLRQRVSFIRSKEPDILKKRQRISYYINKWQICYRIYKSPFFLKQIIYHLNGNDKENWLDYQLNAEQTGFNLVHRFVTFENHDKEKASILAKINKLVDNYQAPTIYGGEFYGEKLTLKDLLAQKTENLNGELLKIKEAAEEKDRLAMEQYEADQRAKAREEKNAIYWRIFWGILIVGVIYLIYLENQ